MYTCLNYVQSRIPAANYAYTESEIHYIAERLQYCPILRNLVNTTTYFQFPSLSRFSGLLKD